MTSFLLFTKNCTVRFHSLTLHRLRMDHQSIEATKFKFIYTVYPATYELLGSDLDPFLLNCNYNVKLMGPKWHRRQRKFPNVFNNCINHTISINYTRGRWVLSLADLRLVHWLDSPHFSPTHTINWSKNINSPDNSSCKINWICISFIEITAL